MRVHEVKSLLQSQEKNIWQSEGILQNGQRYLSQIHIRQVTYVWLYKELQKLNTLKSQTIQFKNRAVD